MKIEAIIFDMDGVIVDTEFFDFSIQKEFIRQENSFINLETTDFSELIGQSYNMLYETLKRFIGSTEPLEIIGDKFTKFSDEKYKSLNYKKLFRGDTLFLLEYAKEKQIKLAVASSSTYSHIVEVLSSCGILSYFDVIYSGEFVEQSKPNPQVYLNVLEKLNIASEFCIAIEDSSYGITAANEAGITTIAYQETRVPVYQDHAAYLAKNMEHVQQIITELNISDNVY
ncbi:HAD family hydrolase [Enterococcus sp. DIV0086]|uniref:HAD family hydrolase n=1 Tax=Enterococcus sp. DIV0086 TaxID=2774655 RepID=UPI003D283FA0